MLYESRPYLIIVFAVLAVALSGFNGFVIACAVLLAGGAAVILKMRREFRSREFVSSFSGLHARRTHPQA